MPFQISEYAAFSDVDAGSWYADAVYNANDLGYMTGIKGTDLFMPLADISRAELSKVFFNMAGQSEEEGVYFPSAFADVDGWAWYAQPVAWASEAGIVTGYDADTFGPMDKASREQVAVMLYRYAKAQGKDVSVKDADAALAAYKDGDQVSDWAKTAMAWAVENGIFGVDTTSSGPTRTSSAPPSPPSPSASSPRRFPRRKPHHGAAIGRSRHSDKRREAPRPGSLPFACDRNPCRGLLEHHVVEVDGLGEAHDHGSRPRRG